MVAERTKEVESVLLLGEQSRLGETAEVLRAEMKVVELFSVRDGREIEAGIQSKFANGRAPSVVLIALPAEKAILAARISRRLLRSAELLLLLEPADLDLFRRKAAHAPLGPHRIVTKTDPGVVLASIRQQIRASNQRRSFRTTIDRINLQITASRATEPGEVRRLLMADRYRASLIANAIDAIISVDKDRRITAWNRSADYLFAATINEGDLLKNLQLGTCGEALSDSVEKIFSGNQLPRQEISCLLPSGRPIAIEATFAPVLDDQQKVIGVSIIARDITEAKRAERLLRMEHQITRQLVEPGDLHDILEGVLRTLAGETEACVAEFWSVDEAADTISAEIIWSDPAQNNLNEFTRQSRELHLPRGEGLPGRVWENPTEVVFCDPTADQNFSRRTAAARAGLRSGLAFPISTGGQFLGAINLFGTAELRADPALFRMIRAVATDLAQWIQRRRAEKALEASERELRALANSIPQLAWIADADGNISWYNQGWFDYTGTTLEQMKGWGWQSVHDPVILPKVLERWKHSIDQGVPFEMEFPLRAADGSFRWFLTRVNPVRDQNQRILRWFGTNTDVEEVRRSREALKAAQAELQKHAATLEEEVARRTAQLSETIQELEAFSYSISHDMRSPLRAMQGYAEALMEDYSADLDEAAVGYLERIQRAARRMDLLIQDVLAYSRVAKGDIHLHPTDVESVIQDVIQNYPNLQPDRARITVEGPLPPVMAHEAYVTQIVSNLLGNAVKFVSPGTFPTVTISATVSGEMVRFAFRDNGIGMTLSQQEHIFHIFGRIHPEKKYEGTGIGLAIVKKAAERMGGSAGVNSELGKGSEFFVLLKRVE